MSKRNNYLKFKYIQYLKSQWCIKNEAIIIPSNNKPSKYQKSYLTPIKINRELKIIIM